MKNATLLAGLVSIALLLAGCGDGDSDPFFVGPDPDPVVDPAPEPAPLSATLAAFLHGDVQLPRVASGGHGQVTLEISGDRQSADFEIVWHGLGDVAGIHIHLGEVGTTGGHLFDLATSTVTSPFVGTVTGADLMLHPGHGIATFEDALQALEEGRAYVNVHTSLVPSGELRGQIGGVQLGSFLNSDQTVPAVESNAGAFAHLSFDTEQTELTIHVEPFNVPHVDAVHLHLGGLGETGPHIFTLHGLDFSQPSEVTVTEADLEPSATVTGWHDAVRAILAGDSYLNVHTAGNPTGEIRGQVGAQHIRAYVGGYQAVPLTISTGLGFVDIFVGGMQDKISFDANIGGLDDITATHIHHGLPEVAGGHFFTLSDVPFSGTATGTLGHHDMHALPEFGINTFADALSSIFIGDAYVNVHTVGAPHGEVRGQLGIVRIHGALDGVSVVPPVLSLGSGTATYFINQRQDRIDYELEIADMVGVTGAHAWLGHAGLETDQLVFEIAGHEFTDSVSGSFGNPSPTAGGGAGGGGGGGGHAHPLVLLAHEFPDPGNPPPLGPLDEFEDIINHLIAGFSYVEVETIFFPDGELRGQMHP